MISCQSQSDAGIRRLVSLVTQICLSEEFQQLRDELACMYAESGHKDGDVTAFEDALYAMIVQFEDFDPELKELMAHL